jgi:hypothetical protein
MPDERRGANPRPARLSLANAGGVGVRTLELQRDGPGSQR